MIDILLKKTGTALKDFCSSLVEGLQTASTAMNTSYTDQFTRASYYNGRKMVLQKALNEIFALAANSIRIVCNRTATLAPYVYESSETDKLYVKESSESPPLYIYESSEFAVAEADFVVQIPIGIYTATFNQQVKAEVETFKLIGKTYVTETY